MSDSNDNLPPDGSEQLPSPPKAVISRLSLYLRELQHLVRDGKETVSSTALGQVLGFSDAQVRKDLTTFGQFGYPGVGYRCEELIDEIKRILGTDREWPVVLIGVGNLGRALLGYKGFDDQGFRIAAAFDIDETRIGSSIEGIHVYRFDELPDFIQSRSINMAIIAVPALQAQSVADQLVAAGITGMLNFAPVTLAVPESVSVIGVDLAIELEQLSFAVVKQAKSS